MSMFSTEDRERNDSNEQIAVKQIGGFRALAAAARLEDEMSIKKSPMNEAWSEARLTRPKSTKSVISVCAYADAELSRF